MVKRPPYHMKIKTVVPIYRITKSISDTKKPKDTFIGGYTLEKYEGLSRQKLMVSISNPKVSA